MRLRDSLGSSYSEVRLGFTTASALPIPRAVQPQAGSCRPCTAPRPLPVGLQPEAEEDKTWLKKHSAGKALDYGFMLSRAEMSGTSQFT